MSKTIFSSTIISVALLILFSCQSRESDDKSERGYLKDVAAPAEEKEKQESVVNSDGPYVVTSSEASGAMTDEPSSNAPIMVSGNKNGFISSSAAVASKDTSKKFIRTANMKFRVGNVLNSTLAIEDITAHFNGYVTYTHLASEVSHNEIIPVSADSSLETIYYVVTNHMIVRVPNAKLDTALRQIAQQIDFLDYRTIQAEDITLSLMANRLTQLRLSGHNERLTRAIDERGKKLNETTQAEENLLSKKEQADNTTISTLTVMDKVEYSMITIDIYQRKTVKRGLIENYKNTKAYEPGFFSQVGEGVTTGWYFLKKVAISLVNIWPIILIGILGWFVFRRYTRKK